MGSGSPLIEHECKKCGAWNGNVVYTTNNKGWSNFICKQCKFENNIRPSPNHWS